MTLTEQYLDLVHRQLPAAAQRWVYPVRFHHCFARIILDALFEDVWYRHLPAYKHLTAAQLAAATPSDKPSLLTLRRALRPIEPVSGIASSAIANI